MTKTEQAEKKKKILELIQDGAPVSKACKKVGIHRDTFYDWQQSDDGFMVAVGHAKRLCIEETDDAAEFYMNKWVREGHQKSVYKWLEARHASFRKRDAFTLAVKEPEAGVDEEGVPVDMTKEQFFNILRAAELTRGVGVSPDLPRKLIREFEEWKVKHPRGTG